MQIEIVLPFMLILRFRKYTWIHVTCVKESVNILGVAHAQATWLWNFHLYSFVTLLCSRAVSILVSACLTRLRTRPPINAKRASALWMSPKSPIRDVPASTHAFHCLRFLADYVQSMRTIASGIYLHSLWNISIESFRPFTQLWASRARQCMHLQIIDDNTHLSRRLSPPIFSWLPDTEQSLPKSRKDMFSSDAKSAISWYFTKTTQVS